VRGVPKTNEEFLYVHNREELQSTVQRLVTDRGGVVQNQSDDEVVVYVKTKMNIVVLVVGLLLCLVPGLAYLIWYLTADQNQLIHVKVGAPSNIGGYHPVNEYEVKTGADGPQPGPSGSTPPSSAGSLPPQSTSDQVPTMPGTPDATPITPTTPGTPPPSTDPEPF
jgi:hypothetical protein